MRLLSFISINRRLQLSLTVTFIGILLSFIYLRPTVKTKKQLKLAPFIAKLNYSLNEVQVKPKNQLLWKDIQNGDSLRQGDLIRTAQNASAEVKFLKSDISIKLGAETTVTIEDKKGELELNMLEGDIFVASNSKQKVNLKSKDKEFDLSKGQVGFEVSEKGDVEVEVLAGELKTNDAKNKIITKNQKLVMTDKGSELKQNYFEFIKPEIGKNIYIHPNKQTVLFKWKKHKFNYDYKIFIGRSKSRMSEIKYEKKTRESIEVKIPVGIFYWQIKAVAQHFSFESAKIQSNFLGINPPVLLDPMADESLFLEPGQKFAFKWSQGSVEDNAVIEISDRKDFSTILESQLVTDMNIYTPKNIVKAGKYHWRVRGSVNEEFEEVISTPNMFTLKFVKGLIPPIIQFPKNGDKIINTEQTQITFAWKAPPKIKKFQINITNKSDFALDKKVESTNFLYTFTKDGEYFWTVKSIDKDGNLSESSKEYKFTLKKIPVLAFTDLEKKVFFNQSETILNLKWEAVDEIDFYTVKIDNIAFGEKSFNTPENLYLFPVRNKGIYKVKVLAIKDNAIVAQTNPIDISVIEHPLLRPPMWDEETKILKQTDGLGNIEVKFMQVKDASYYLVEVRDLNAKIIKIIQADGLSAKIKSLLPGKYQFYVRSVDKFNRKSEMSESLLIDVPIESSIEKPKINKVQIR